MEKAEILTKKRRGDYELIAEMTGYAKETVKKQVLGRRTLTTKVIDAFTQLFQSRKDLMK